jgi:hypothetical protein
MEIGIGWKLPILGLLTTRRGYDPCFSQKSTDAPAILSKQFWFSLLGTVWAMITPLHRKNMSLVWAIESFVTTAEELDGIFFYLNE